LEDEQDVSSDVLDALNRVFREALTCESEEELATTCLAVAEDLTNDIEETLSLVNEIWERKQKAG